MAGNLSKGDNRELTLDHSGNSGSFVASGNGHILHARRFHPHPLGARRRGGVNSGDPRPSSRLTGSCRIFSAATGNSTHELPVAAFEELTGLASILQSARFGFATLFFAAP